MTTRTTRRALLLMPALLLAAGLPRAAAATPAEQMTRGKVAADLGDHRAAEQAFARLARDSAAPATARGEALVRLGVVRRAMGKKAESAAAFREAMQTSGRDAQVTRLLTLAVAGVVPDRARWATQWLKVRLALSSAASGAEPSIQWPDPAPQGVRETIPATDPVTLDLEDVPLSAVLRHLMAGLPPRDRIRSVGFENWPASYRPPAVVETMDFVIHAGVQDSGNVTQGPRVTVKVAEMPWNELLENILASHGLSMALDRNMLLIAKADDLGAFAAHTGGRMNGVMPVTMDFLTAQLSDLFRLFKDMTGFHFAPDADVKGHVTMRLRDRPAMQVVALALAANDLAAVRTSAPPDQKPGTTALRICRRGGPGCNGIDLSKLVPAPAP